MRASIRDVSTLAALRPLEVVAYLRASGWNKVAEKADQASTWLKTKDKEEYEVVAPLTDAFRDFALRMSDVLQVLEAVENRSQLEILHDLLVTSADVIRLRIAENTVTDGSVPIEEGAQFFQESKNLLLAAACAAASPKAYYPTRKPAQAMDYLRKVRLGQTEPGSYVLTIISRVPPSLSAGDGKLFDVEEPFERKVTQTLATALAAARASAATAAETGQVKSFLDSVPKGVSANLCDALAAMGGTTSGTRSLQVGFTWSRTRPLAPDLHIPEGVSFSPDTFPVIEEAAAHLEESSPRDEFELRGPVVKLQRPDGAQTGLVTVDAYVDEQPRKVTVELGDPDYTKAIDAHKHVRIITCSGTLIREGKAYRLVHPVNFTTESGD
jgi:hypothetical protein